MDIFRIMFALKSLSSVSRVSSSSVFTFLRRISSSVMHINYSRNIRITSSNIIVDICAVLAEIVLSIRFSNTSRVCCVITVLSPHSFGSTERWPQNLKHLNDRPGLIILRRQLVDTARAGAILSSTCGMFCFRVLHTYILLLTYLRQ